MYLLRSKDLQTDTSIDFCHSVTKAINQSFQTYNNYLHIHAIWAKLVPSNHLVLSLVFIMYWYMIVSTIQVVSQLVLSITVVCLNGPFLIALLKTASLHTPSNAALGCLCFSDVIIGTVSIISWSLLSSIMFGDYVEDFTKLFALMIKLYFIIVGFSALFIIAVNLDRYASICHPYKYLQYATPKLYVIISVCAVFSYAAVVCCLLLIFNIYTYYVQLLMAIVIGITILIIVFCNWRIFRIIRRHRRQIVAQVTCEHHNRLDREGKRHNVIVVLVISFLICNMPIILLTIGLPFDLPIESRLYSSVSILSHFFVELNSIINPLVYLFRIRIFRNAVKELFCFQRQV